MVVYGKVAYKRQLFDLTMSIATTNYMETLQKNIDFNNVKVYT